MGGDGPWDAVTTAHVYGNVIDRSRIVWKVYAFTPRGKTTSKFEAEAFVNVCHLPPFPNRFRCIAGAENVISATYKLER